MTCTAAQCKCQSYLSYPTAGSLWKIQTNGSPTKGSQCRLWMTCSSKQRGSDSWRSSEHTCDNTERTDGMTARYGVHCLLTRRQEGSSNTSHYFGAGLSLLEGDRLLVEVPKFLCESTLSDNSPSVCVHVSQRCLKTGSPCVFM